MNGAFERAFASEGVTFNRHNGAFQMQQQYKRSVQLLGEGEAALWTKRALEREGISVKDQADFKIEVSSINESPQWSLHNKTQTLQFFSIYGLINALREEGATVGV